MAQQEIEYVKVHTLSDRFEADVITDALEKEGIPVLVRPFMETAYSNIFVSQKGWGHIMAPRDKADLARTIISALTREIEEEAQNSPATQSQTGRISSAQQDSAGDKLVLMAKQLDGLQIDPQLWEELRQCDPQEVASRAIVSFDPGSNAYVVALLNREILCRPGSEEIVAVEGPEDFSKDFQIKLAILHYLLHAGSKPGSGKWVSEKDLPGGSLFFTAAHALPTDSLIAAFDGRPEVLDAAAKRIGGEKDDTGGISYRFRVMPRIPFLLLFWERDEEFEPSCHLLFEETILAQLGSLDLIWALVNIFTRSLLAAAASLSESNPSE